MQECEHVRDVHVHMRLTAAAAPSNSVFKNVRKEHVVPW